MSTSSPHRRPLAFEPVEIFQGSVTDPELLDVVCAGADAVVHLGGYAGDAPWPELSRVNVGGTYEVLEAARRQGVRRLVVASSNHAVGFHVRGAEPLADDVAPRPDSLYGASKAAGEALCRFYADKFSMDVVCLRIGSCFDVPANLRMLATWLSPADFVRLTAAALMTPLSGFRLVWGVSANTRRWWSTEGGNAIGFHPEDDAERFAGLYPGNLARARVRRRGIDLRSLGILAKAAARPHMKRESPQGAP